MGWNVGSHFPRGPWMSAGTGTSEDSKVRVKVLFFARAREAAGVSEADFAFPAGSTLADSEALLVAVFPVLAPLLGVRGGTVLALNGEYPAEAPERIILREGDELAVIPPVSGG